VSSSAGYLSFPVTTDADTLATQALSYLTQQLPGWVPREGHLEVWMIRAFARMCAETAAVAAQVPLGIFQYFGTALLNLPALAGSQAQCQSTWTLTDTLGHTIPAGTTVGYRTSPDGLVLLRTTADVTVPAGQYQTAIGGVTLQAVVATAAANGLAPAQLIPVDNLSFVATIVSTTTTAGGADPEDQAAYLDRLATELTLLTPRPILPADFAALARNQPAVARATAIDGYNPADGSLNNARMVTVAVVDAEGNALTTTQQDAVADALEAQREVNFVVNVVAPTYTAVNVSAQVTAQPGQSLTAVTAACAAALTDLLSPANWGGPAPAWTNTSTVRYLTVGAVLAAVPGVRFVSGLQLSVGAGALQPQDAQLPGAVPLPTPGTINVVVSPAT
jgi:hypothetical protein